VGSGHPDACKTHSAVLCVEFLLLGERKKEGRKEKDKRSLLWEGLQLLVYST
jgi:hypothetical protein